MEVTLQFLGRGVIRHQDIMAGPQVVKPNPFDLPEEPTQCAHVERSQITGSISRCRNKAILARHGYLCQEHYV